MNFSLTALAPALILVPFLLASACNSGGPEMKTATTGPRVITVAQSGQADVVGDDNAALQKAADMLNPGDTLVIGSGTWQMVNSLFIPCSDVVVRGTAGETVLRKGPGITSRVVDCGDYGEDVLVVAEPEKFKPGMGISVMDDEYNGDWAITVTAVREVRGDTLFLTKRTWRDYDYESKNARVENKFPILCGIGVNNVTIENITVDGNLSENPYFIDGCRGGAIYLYESTNCTIRGCTARYYNGDGISFQITDRIKVIDCESFGNSNYGVHPGTGSPNAEITGCHFHDNGQIGFFLCWRVRYGRFSDNLIENNGLYGISIGHKDTDNLFVKNTIRGNGFAGVYFRQESLKLSGHRNVFRENEIVDNGDSKRGYGVYVDPHAGDIVIENNHIADTRQASARTQQYGVYVTKGGGAVTLKDNRMEGLAKGEFVDENK